MDTSRVGRLVVLTIVVLSTACSKESPAPRTAPEPIIVSAAASTSEVVELLCNQFSESSGVKVHVNSGASNALAGQILAGAPADLFLSANAQWAKEIEMANLAAATARLLTNNLVIAVPKGNPAGVHQPKDLLSDKVKKVALAGEAVPAGMYADQSLTKLELLKPLTDAGKIVRGGDVRATLSYVERGEAEAGIVYSTDARVANNVEVVHEFDPKLHDEIVYVLVLLKHGSDNRAAKDLYDLLQSPNADKTYQEYGFTRPPNRAE